MKNLSALLRLMARLHCGLIAAILSAAAFSMLPLVVPVSLSPQGAFWRGLLFALPTALCWYAVKRLPALWQFLLAGLGLCGLSWLLMGHPGGAAMMLLMCILRARTRLEEEEENRPIPSVFDRPVLPVLTLFAGVWLASALLGLPPLQRLSLLGGALYLLLCLAHHGLERLEAYLLLNQGMAGLPARRIRRIAGSAALAAVAVAGALLLPPALTDPGSLRIDLPDPTLETPPVRYEAPEGGQAAGELPAMDMDLSGLVDGPTWQIPEWVSYLFFGIVGIILLGALYAGVRGLMKNFRLSFADGRDVIQSLEREDRDQAESVEDALRAPRLFDRSPEARVRRRYRRAILRAAKEPPKPWHTPEELEAAAGLAEPELHREYETLRYGKP